MTALLVVLLAVAGALVVAGVALAVGPASWRRRVDGRVPTGGRGYAGGGASSGGAHGADSGGVDGGGGGDGGGCG